MKITLFWSCTAAMTLLASNLACPAVEIVAHRGASFDAPENTLSSMKLGYQQQGDACELDIYLTRDGRLAVSHDPSPLRTGGVSNQISKMTFEEVHRVDVGKWGKWAGKGFSEPLPALEEVIALIPDGKKLFIEVKCGAEAMPELDRVLKKSGKQASQLVIIGFGYETMRAAKKKLPMHQVYWLVSGTASSDKKSVIYPSVQELISKAKAAGLDGLNLDWNFPIDATFAQQVHDAGLKLLTWTVDDPKVARRLAAAGVDGITTNRPQWLREQLATAP